jgi:hypothetical protein
MLVYPAMHGLKSRKTTPARLANAELRAVKSQAHTVFDLLWQSGLLSRSAAYEWLVSAMDSHCRDCHFAMFDVAQCQTAMALSQVKLDELQTQAITVG